eukprot:1189872-Prorocentrum_minimum.AAC.4
MQGVFIPCRCGLLAPPTDPLGDASRRRSARPIAWRGRASSRNPAGGSPLLKSGRASEERGRARGARQGSSRKS